jgi:hypothetical protein
MAPPCKRVSDDALWGAPRCDEAWDIAGQIV